MSDLQAYPSSANQEPSGIGGWLLFFILTMTVFGPASLIVAFLRSYRHTIEVFGRALHPYSHYLFYATEQLTGIALYAYAIFVGIQLWKSRLGAITRAKRFLLLFLLYHAVDFVMAVNIVWLMDGPGALGRYLPHALVRQARYLVYPAVWYWYLLKSKRVRNTFFSEHTTPA